MYVCINIYIANEVIKVCEMKCENYVGVCFDHEFSFICIYFQINPLVDKSFVCSSSRCLYLKMLYETLLSLVKYVNLIFHRDELHGLFGCIHCFGL